MRILSLVPQERKQTGFKGKKEILFNLGKGIEKAQEQTYKIKDMSYKRYINNAVTDKDFVDFINNYEKHVNKPTRSFWLNRQASLKSIADMSVTEPVTYPRGFKAFGNVCQELLISISKHNLKQKGLMMEKFQAFIEAIKPV